MKKAISDNVIYSSGNYKRAGRANRAEKKQQKLNYNKKQEFRLKLKKKAKLCLMMMKE